MHVTHASAPGPSTHQTCHGSHESRGALLSAQVSQTVGVCLPDCEVSATDLRENESGGAGGTGRYKLLGNIFL